MIAYVLNPSKRRTKTKTKRRAKNPKRRSKSMARRRRRKGRRRVYRRRRRNTTTARANPRRRKYRRRAPRRRRYRRRRNTALTAKTMYTNPRRRRRRRRPTRRRRRRSYRRNPKFKIIPSMRQIQMSLWGGGGFLVNKIAGNAALYMLARFIPGFNTLPGLAKAISAPIVGTALATFAVNFFPRNGRTYAQAGVNIALGYGLLQALLGPATGLGARIHPMIPALLQGDDYVSSGALAGLGDYVQEPLLGDYVTAGLGESALPDHVAASGIEPYMSSGSLGAGMGYGNLQDFYYGV